MNLKVILWEYSKSQKFLQTSISEPNSGTVNSWRSLAELEKHIEWATQKAKEETETREFFLSVIV